MQKQALRTLYTAKRNELSQDTIHRLSQEITTQVFQNFDIRSKTVSLFLTINTKKEIQTEFLLTKLLAQNNAISVSKSDFTTNNLQHYLYEGNEQLEISKFGIPEPTYGQEITSEKLDFVFVPLLCVDEKGYRVGYGKGFYDRFLSACRKDCVFIGLSFFEPIATIEDRHENDVPLHFVVTPTNVFRF
ncbi:MAG TPA: 5-formyltetrahydrofolate cyclo-ligase [Crocinitomicaceae bacterium]|nr:5-formyltetrahydrofolate cyclo-ligase [Crocinitomicaceae bacterium]